MRVAVSSERAALLSGDVAEIRRQIDDELLLEFAFGGGEVFFAFVDEAFGDGPGACDTLDAGSIVPGFACPVSDLFAGID